MGERVDDGLCQAGAAGQHRGDFAVRGQRLVAVPQVGDCPRDEPEALQRRLAGADGAHEPPHQLPPRRHQDRRHRGVEGPIATTDQRGGLGRIRRATEEAEERELVDGANVVRTAPHRLCEGGCDRAGAQSVAEGLPGAEVRGERHRGEQLGQTELRADHESERY